MKYIIGETTYSFSSGLNDFQRDLYIHLADWKRNHGAEAPGFYKGQSYDLVFPDRLESDFHIFPPVREQVGKLNFKKHKFFRHMASSQAACVNLFVPLLQSPDLAAQILRTIKPDLASIATEELDGGYQLEFWGNGLAVDVRGFLNDHNNASGTDADVAIAYRDHENQLNLWLIEHKLSEAEFTTCQAKSSERRSAQHRCTSAADVYRDPSLCYYQSGRSYRYWDVTKESQSLFLAEKFMDKQECPFMKGLNQLWRNQLLAYAIERHQQLFKKVFFSVVHHPGNKSLAPSIQQFKQLLNTSDRFFTFTSSEILKAASRYSELSQWVNWYQELYLWKKAW